MDAKQVFNAAAADYDRPRRQLVPYFDDFYGTALSLIPHPADSPIRVLDLGAGTGLLSALVAEVFPQASFTLVDISTEMLAKARARFADRPGFGFRVLDLAADPLEGEYDVAVSALALHHLEHPDLAKAFRNIYGALVSGGVFINADQTLGSSPENERQFDQAWHRDIRAQGSSEADVTAAVERMKADKTATLADQLAWLREAGFIDVECWYRRYRFAVYSGQKP